MTRIERTEAGLSTNRILGGVLAGICAVAVGLLGVRYFWPGVQPPETMASVEATRSRSVPPSVDGVALKLASASPPAPDQWSAGPGGIPSATWWSSLVMGGGSEVVWANPLAVRIDADGRLEADTPVRQGDRASFEPDLFLELAEPSDDRSISVVGYGAFHVTARVGGEGSADERADSLGITLVQGSPFVEAEVRGELWVTVPGMVNEPDWGEGVTGSEPEAVTSVMFETLGGPWILASDRALVWFRDGDRLSVSSADGMPFRLVAGPGFTDQAQLRTLALGAAANPVLETAEALEVGEDGSVYQRLTIRRVEGAESVFALLAHQSRFAATGEWVGERVGPLGPMELVRAGELEVSYSPVPLIWDPLIVEGIDPDAIANDLDAGSQPSVGSYYGGKEALRLAQLAQVAQAAGKTKRPIAPSTGWRPCLVTWLIPRWRLRFAGTRRGARS